MYNNFQKYLKSYFKKRTISTLWNSLGFTRAKGFQSSRYNKYFVVEHRQQEGRATMPQISVSQYPGLLTFGAWQFRRVWLFKMVRADFLRILSGVFPLTYRKPRKIMSLKRCFFCVFLSDEYRALPCYLVASSRTML